MDLVTGAFTQIGSDTPEGEAGLVQAANGSLLTLTYSGNLDSINPANGATTVIGPTGLGNCTTPASRCGTTSANNLAGLAGTTYATDYQNDLYKINPLTGAATLIGPTGIPAVPEIPFSTNPDGSTNLFDSTLFSAGGKLYATFDAFEFNFATSALKTVVAPDLYLINPATGAASIVAPTELNLGAVVGVNGTYYAFDDLTDQEVNLNLTNGSTNVLGAFDPAAGVIDGASPVPEPAAVALAGVGLILVAVFKLKGRRCHSLRKRQ